MKILDRAALVIGAAGMWLYMASVEQEEWEEERRSRAFAAWIRTGSLKG